MADDDFDVDSLAVYLHLDPAQVAKLADRGKIPGRKIAGRWRFSSHEVHHWLEERIGLSDDDQLAHMESALQRAAPAGEEPPLALSELISTSAIAVPLSARTKGSVITAMTELAANTGNLWDPKKMAEAVAAREAMQPTALENGVALLHPRRPMPAILAQPLLALGITPNGIAFGSTSGGMTDIFFLIASTDDQGHLRVLARLARLIADPLLLSLLRQSPDAATAYDLIAQRDAKLG